MVKNKRKMNGEIYQRKNRDNNEHEIYGEPPPPYPGEPTQVLTPGNPTILLQSLLHEDPVRLICPYCQADVVTSIRYKNGAVTWLASGFMCLVGLYLGCCLIPFFVKRCKDVIHSCPKCKTKIGKYTRM